jgi:farnesyl diphosphate synthase
VFASTISLYQENYGKSDPQCVAAVKNVYKELDLQVYLLLLQQLEVELLPTAEAF